MQKPTAFEKMRKNKAVRDKQAADMRAYYARLDLNSKTRQIEREARELEMKLKFEQAERETKEGLDRALYEAGMVMWGSDLQACLLGLATVPAPMPPVYGGEPYKMMKIPKGGE